MLEWLRHDKGRKSFCEKEKRKTSWEVLNLENILTESDSLKKTMIFMNETRFLD